MENKYWWREKKKENSNQTESKAQTDSKYWWREKGAAEAAQNIYDRVNKFLTGHNSYIQGYQDRYADRKGYYEDAYVADSGSYLSSAQKQYDSYKAEADDILSYLGRYEDYLYANWVKSVKDAVGNARYQQMQILDAHGADNDFWSDYNTAEMIGEYGSAEEAYKADQRKYGYSKTYSGKTTSELDNIISNLEDGEEKDWLKSYRSGVDYEEKKVADIGALEKELEKLAWVDEEYTNIVNLYDAVKNRPHEFTEEERNDITDQYYMLTRKWGNPKEFNAMLANKRQYVTLAKRVQESEKLAGVADPNSEFYDPEFSKYTEFAGSTRIDNKWYQPDPRDDSVNLKTGYEDIRYDFINNPSKTMEDIDKTQGEYADKILTALLPYRQMDKSQVATYNYYYAKHGREAANKYLDSIQESLNVKEGTALGQRAIENPFLKYTFFVNAGLDQFASGVQGAINLAKGNEDYVPTTVTKAASEVVREDLKDIDLKYYNFKTGKLEDTDIFGSSLGQSVYDLGTTTVNMVPSILVSTAVGAVSKTAGAVVGNTLMGGSAAGNAYNEVINQGYGKAEAQAYATAVGVSESILQYLLGGIGKLGGLSSKITNAVAGIDNGLLRFSLQYGGKFASEALEEGLQEILDPVFKNAILHADEDINWSEVAYSALLSGLSAGTLEGPDVAINVASEQALKKKYDGKTDSLINEGLQNEVNTESYQLAQQYKVKTDAGKTLTGAEIRKLVEANESQAKAKAYKDTVSKAKSRFAELGVAENVNELSEIAAKRATGHELTKKEKSKLANSEYGAKVAKELKDEAEGKAVSYKSLEDRVGAETTFKVAKDGQGKAIDLGNVEVTEFVKDKDGNIVDMVINADGKTVKASEVEYADGDQSYLFEAVSKIENITPRTATTIIRDYDPSSGQSVGEYLNGIDEAYTYGYHGYNEADLNAGNFAPKLTETQMKSAYELGKDARSQNDADADAPIVRMRTAAEAKQTAEQKAAKQKARIESDDVEVYFRDGKATVKFDEHTGKYDKKRMAAVNTAKFLSKLGIGGKYYFFESYVNADGVRVYKDTNGNEVEAPNGIYKESDGSIHIDLNAGEYGQGTALFTLGHELAHFVKDQSKKQFKILGNLVTEAFDKTDMSMHERVLAKQKFLQQRRNGEKVSYDEAYEEVVADAMSTMLSNGSFYEMLMEIKVKDKGLFDTIKRFFEKMIAKFTKAYEGLDPDQQDARDIREIKDMFDKIQRAFAEALVEASENFQATEVQKNTTENGGVKEQARPSEKNPDLLDPRSVTREDVRKLLQNVEAGLYAENTYIPVRISTPGIVQERLFAKDLPMAMPVKKVKQEFELDLGPVAGKNARGHELTVDELLYVIEMLDSPDYLFSQSDGRGVAVVMLPGSPVKKTVIVDFGQDINAAYMNGFDGGRYNISITAFDIDGGDVGLFMKQLEKGWHKVFDKQKEGDPAKKFQATRPFAIEQDTLDERVPQEAEEVKSESAEALDVEVDTNTESVAPKVMKSERTWTESDYVQERNKAAKEIAKAIGVTEKKAKDYIDSINSIAKMIAEDRTRLDYFSSPGRSSFVSNVEYGGSFDFSTLCKKRRLLTGTFTAIQKALPNTALTADEILDIRNRMKEAGLEVSCGLCYVEGSRANMGQFAKEFLRLYKQYYPDAWQPNMADVNTPDGIEWVRINHPEVYEQYEYFWNHYGTLKEGDKNLFASQQKPKLYQLHTEYKGEILEKFNDDENVEEKNINGGIRLQSFSDFEIVHLIDTMQIIMDMSRVGLAGQAYTKVPDFAWALGDTGLKINLSLIAKGVDADGKLIFDDVEGMPIAEAMKLRDRYSKNVGTILVAFNDEQLLAAMADDRVDFIIPFHRSQWKKSQYEAMGLPAKTKDYTYMQNEKYLKPQFHEYRGRMVKDKATNYMPNEYWDFSKSGKENAEAYLEMCARNNKRPKFYKLLQNNGDGSYSLKADGSTDGYWKLLIDFKMYDNDGIGSPQMAVKPEFNMDEATRMLEAYKGGHSNFPVAQGIVDSFVNDYRANHKGQKLSERGEGTSNRDMLANAFETISKNSEEYKMIQEYKSKVNLLNKLEQDLNEVNQEIRDIHFGEKKYDAERLKLLEGKAKRLANDITKNDRRLLNMEASAPLRRVIQEERKKEAQRTKAHVKEIQQNKKARAEQTELRHKIRRTIRDLNKILNRGNKKQNVKEDMRGFVSKALELADYLFTDHISNDDLIRKGINPNIMRGNEAQLVKETEDILTQLYDNADSLTDEEFTRLDAKRKANEDKLRELLTKQRNERLNTPVYNLFNDLVTEYASLKNSQQEAVKGAYDPKVEEFLRSYLGENADGTDSDRKTLLQNMRVADMTTEELWKLHNAYTMVLHSVRQANSLFVKGKTESIEQMVGRITSDFSKRKAPEGKVATVIRNLTNKLGWYYEKLYYALDRIGSEAFTELVMNLADAENTVMQDIKEAVAFRDEIVKKYDFNNWAVNKEIDKEFLDNTGKKFKLTLGQLMSLYAYSRREGAWDHIEYGGFSFKDTPITENNSAASYKLSKEQCESITNTLTKEQKGYVEDMQKFLSDTMGGKGNEVSMLLYGIKMFGEKNYFPIHIDGRYKAQAQESQAKQAAGFGTMSNAGFTHAQNPNAKAPFVLEGFNEVWADHVNEMSRYHGTVPALEDLRRVMNRSSYSDAYADSMSVKVMMENAFGKEAVEYFDNLYREANSGAIQDKLQRVPKKLLSLFRKNSVAYSLSVVIQQPSAMARAYAMIDKKYFGFKGVGALTSGVAKAVSSKWNPAYAKAYNEMLKYAPGVTMAKEIGGFDTHTGSSIREYLLDTGKSFKQSVKTENLLGKGKAVLELVDDNAIANLPSVADKIAWIEIWNACKREAVSKHKNLATNSDEFLQIVGDRFTEVIRATQVYDSIFSKSPMLKSKSLAVQYLVSFMNEPNTTANMVEKAVRDAINGDWKGGLRIAGAVTYSIIFNNVLKAIVYAMRDDDEDETYIEKYLAAVAGGMMDDFNPISYIPIARDAWSKIRGYDVERPDMAIIADAIDAFKAKAKLKDKDIEDMTEEEIAELDKKMTEANWKLVGSLAAFFGIPVKNIYREIEGVIDQARIASKNAGMTTASGIWDKVKEEVIDSIPFASADSTKSGKLYDAIISGEPDRIKRQKAQYADEKAVESAMREEIKDRFKSGDIDNDTAKKYLINYGGLDKDDAESRVRYWSYIKEHPEYKKYELNESNVNKYLDFAKPAGISMDVFVQYRDKTKGIKSVLDEYGDVEVTAKEQVLDVIDSLPITDKQKDALYLAHGYAESEIWDVPW